jgi:glycosyltransferase involved in cell wall biosynthesis
MQKANYVITCTPYLHDIAKKHNSKTIDISSTVNTNKYFLKNFKHTNKQLVIGWSGSYSTGPYLQLIEDVIQHTMSEFNLKLLVIGAQKKYIQGVTYELIPWNVDTEVEDLQKIDIGLYPLPNEKWVYGKSGLKAIQFMALGIPVVATAIGTNHRVIDHGINGFLAKNKNDWKNFIKILCENHTKRIEMGKKAREKVKEQFSVNANKNKYLEVFNYSFRNIVN